MKKEDKNIYFVRTTFEVEYLPGWKGKNRASDVRGILYIFVKASNLWALSLWQLSNFRAVWKSQMLDWLRKILDVSITRQEKFIASFEQKWFAV